VLDDRHQGNAEGGEVRQQRWHVWFAPVGLDHRAVLYGLGEDIPSARTRARTSGSIDLRWT
jgi:hypothetical protein